MSTNDGEKKKEYKNALFYQRLFAFLIDVLIVSFASSILSTPFVDSEKMAKVEKQIPEIMEKYVSGEITAQEYFIEYSNAYYSLSRENGVTSIFSLLISVCYFVVYQLYTRGQTLGKKLLNIRVISTQGELFMDQMIFRSLLANFILVDIVTLASLVFSPKNIYIYLSTTVEILQYGFIFLSILFVIFRKDGRAIHDLFARTRVIREK